MNQTVEKVKVIVIFVESRRIKKDTRGHPFVLYIKFTNQTYRSVYEFPEFTDNGKLISFAFVIVVATANDLGIDVEAF